MASDHRLNFDQFILDHWFEHQFRFHHLFIHNSEQYPILPIINFCPDLPRFFLNHRLLPKPHLDCILVNHPQLEHKTHKYFCRINSRKWKIDKWSRQYRQGFCHGSQSWSESRMLWPHFKIFVLNRAFLLNYSIFFSCFSADLLILKYQIA